METDVAVVPPRDDMVATAVAFLQSPRVKEAPNAQQREFLVSKGLTEAEINAALASVAAAAATAPARPPAPERHAPAPAASGTSWWSLLIGVGAVAAAFKAAQVRAAIIFL